MLSKGSQVITTAPIQGDIYFSHLPANASGTIVSGGPYTFKVRFPGRRLVYKINACYLKQKSHVSN